MIRRKIISLLTLILIFLVLVLGSNILPEIFINERREYQFLEGIQTITLLICNVLLFRSRKRFIRVSNTFTFLIRQFFLLFILYEELSFLTFRINKTFFNINLNLTNFQAEFNFHNNIFFQTRLFILKVPSTDITFTLQLSVLVYILFLFFIGYGSYFSFFKGISYFFIDRNYTNFILIIILNFILVLFGFTMIIDEIVELFGYSIFLLDTFKKRKIINERYLEGLKRN